MDTPCSLDTLALRWLRAREDAEAASIAHQRAQLALRQQADALLARAEPGVKLVIATAAGTVEVFDSTVLRQGVFEKDPYPWA